MSDALAHTVTGSQVAGVAAPKRMIPEQSHVAAAVVQDNVSKKEAKKGLFGMNKETEEMASDFAVDCAMTGVPIPGVQAVTAVAAAPFGFMVADYRARRELTKLAEKTQDRLAEYFNITPEQVTPEHFVMAAETRKAQGDTTLSSMLDTIEMDKKVFPFANFAGVGGLAAGAWAAPALAAATIGLGPIGLGLAGLVGGAAGFEMARSGVAGFMGAANSNRDARRIIEDMAEAHEAGEPIPVLEVFKLRMAQNDVASAVVKQMTDRDFYQLNENEQQALMNHPRFAIVAQQCAKDCALVNQPDANVNDLLYGAMPEKKFQNMVRPQTAAPVTRIQRPANENSLADRVTAERETARNAPRDISA